MLELAHPTALTNQKTSGQKTGDGFFGPPALPQAIYVIWIGHIILYQ